MSLLIVCPSCGSQFKAPDRVAGRSVHCLKCKATIAVPALQPALASAAPAAPPPLPVADSMPQTAAPRSPAWLTALLFTGMGVAFFLVIALLVILLNKQTPSPITEAAKGNQPSALEQFKVEPSESVLPAPMAAPIPEVKSEPETKPQLDRAERLAAVEAQEKEVLPPLQAQADKHKPALQKLRKEEDALFPKTIKMNAGQIAKLKARTDTFIKDQTAVLRPAVKDLAALYRKREELLQAKRKVLFEHPEGGDIKLEEYKGLFLTADEVRDLANREANAATPRAAALLYVQNEEIKTIFKGTYYAGAYQDPAVDDLAAIVYRAGSYREKSDLQVHVYLYRLRGVWWVLELPGRANTIYIGTPPSEYKRTDSGS